MWLVRVKDRVGHLSLRVDVSVGLNDESLGDMQPVLLRRKVQRAQAVRGRAVRASAVVQKHAHHLSVALLTRDVQRCIAVLQDI